jgi:hypothetical protein
MDGCYRGKNMVVMEVSGASKEEEGDGMYMSV